MPNDSSSSGGCLSPATWVVVVIIALLMLTLATPYPLMSNRELREVNHKLRHKHAMKGLELAVRGHQTEYAGKPSLTELWTNERTPIPSEGEILKVLVGEDERLNPRKIPFWEPLVRTKPDSRQPSAVKLENGSLRFVDSRGNPFLLILDLNGDGTVPHPDPAHPDEEISGTILIYSSGEDSNPATWQDNLKSWER